MRISLYAYEYMGICNITISSNPSQPTDIRIRIPYHTKHKTASATQRNGDNVPISSSLQCRQIFHIAACCIGRCPTPLPSFADLGDGDFATVEIDGVVPVEG
jgi:hypothetical protein